MSCCSNCIPKEIYGCPQEITIGKVATTEDVKVYFRHPATGRIDIYETTPEMDGTVIIAAPELSFGVKYEVWVAIDVEPLALNGTQFKCLDFTQFKARINEEED
jgi:hypothetical protein